MSLAATAGCDTRTRAVRTTAVLISALPALIVATLCLLPFLGKAFLIDDPYFLAMARQILKASLHPMNFEICWNIVPYCTKAYELTPGNTLMGYALVPTVLGGAAEWMAHATQLIFVWAAVLATSSLMLRFGWSMRHAIVGSLLLVATPPLLPMASTAMPDVLALAVGLIGMERLAAWRDEQKWHRGAAAALSLGLAGIARAHLVLLLPLGAFFLADSLKPREVVVQLRHSLRLWTPIVAGGFLLLLIIYITRESGLLLNPPSVVSGADNIRLNLRSYLQYLCLPLPLAVCWAGARWISDRRQAVMIVLAAAGITWLAGGRQLQLFLALLGAYVVADLFATAWRNRNREEFFLLLWILVPLPIVYYAHLPIKYMLPSMPAVILLCFRLSSIVPVHLARAAGIFLVVAGLAYSLLILRADEEFADFGRAAMARLVRPHVSAGEKVWYPGSFSAYWYAPLAGAELMVPGLREPKPGDLLVVGIREEQGKTKLDRFSNHTVVERFAHRYRFGRTMFDGAGLYTNVAGNWLWEPGTSKDDRYELWRID